MVPDRRPGINTSLLLAKRPWTTDRIRVHFIDCLYGGFGWNDCIGFAPFPDIEVQKKFLAHELSELITPRRSLVEAKRSQAQPWDCSHGCRSAGLFQRERFSGEACLSQC